VPLDLRLIGVVTGSTGVPCNNAVVLRTVRTRDTVNAASSRARWCVDLIAERPDAAARYWSAMPARCARSDIHMRGEGLIGSCRAA
jgi:hypothetical protein